VRELDRGARARDASPPRGEPAASWGAVDALAPHWRPSPGEDALSPVRGQLALHREGLVFRADDVVDGATGRPVVEVLAADEIVSASPLSPGSLMTPTRQAGEWMPRLLRSMRCPGFVVSTAEGPWVFDGPHGVRRADEVHRRFAPGDRTP
jgi:hypothetical protein